MRRLGSDIQTRIRVLVRNAYRPSEGRNRCQVEGWPGTQWTSVWAMSPLPCSGGVTFSVAQSRLFATSRINFRVGAVGIGARDPVLPRVWWPLALPCCPPNDNTPVVPPFSLWVIIEHFPRAKPALRTGDLAVNKTHYSLSISVLWSLILSGMAENKEVKKSPWIF